MALRYDPVASRMSRAYQEVSSGELIRGDDREPFRLRSLDMPGSSILWEEHVAEDGKELPSVATGQDLSAFFTLNCIRVFDSVITLCNCSNKLIGTRIARASFQRPEKGGSNEQKTNAICLRYRTGRPDSLAGPGSRHQHYDRLGER